VVFFLPKPVLSILDGSLWKKRRGSGRAPDTRPNKIDPGTTDAGMIWYDLGNKYESIIIYIPF